MSIFGINTADLAVQKAKTEEIKKQNELLREQGQKALGSSVSNFIGSFLPKFSKGGGIAKGQPAIVGERGAELFIPNQAGQITQASRGTGTGSVNVNFTINTIDSRGFDEALVENEEILQLNNAVNEKGRGNLV